VPGPDDYDWNSDPLSAFPNLGDPTTLAHESPFTDNVSDPVWDSWRSELKKLGGTNPLLHFPQDAAIELSTGHPGGLARFFAGTPTLLRNLVRDDVALHRARAKAITINDKSVELAAARGIDSVMLAVGLVSWTKNGEQFAAPMLVRPVAMHRKGDDIELQLRGGLTLNPALARELRNQFGIALDERTFVALTNDNGSFRPNGALDRLHGLIAHIDGAEVTPTLSVANLSDFAADMLAASNYFVHPVLDALGGNENAVKLFNQPATTRNDFEAGRTGFTSDTLLLDADPEQEKIVAEIVTGNSIVVGTPAGAGATQTVVNAVAELVRQGKRVLVVSPRRARLDAIRRRFRSLGLDGLGVSPTALKGDLIRAIGRIEKSEVPKTADIDSALLRMQTIVRDYRDALSSKDPRFGVSVLEAVRELAHLANSTEAMGEVSLNADSTAALTDSMDEVVEGIMQAAELGQFKTVSATSPWNTAHFDTAEEAATAHQASVRLSEETLTELERMAVEILEPTPLGVGGTLDDIRSRIDLLRGIGATLDRFTAELFDRSIDDFVKAYAPATREDPMPGGQRRRLKKLAKEFVRPGAHIDDMHEALIAASDARAKWNNIVTASYRPAVPVGFTELLHLFTKVEADVSAIADATGRDLTNIPRGEVLTLAKELAEDSASITTIHERTGIIDMMRSRGLENLLGVFAGRAVTREMVRAELELAWWRGVLEAIISDRRQLLGADTTILDRIENDYRIVDQQHLAGNAQRIAYNLADEWRKEVLNNPHETASIKTALTSGRATAKHLFEVAPTLTDTLAPVWCVSPYSTGALAPGQSFDVVFLLDAGAITAAEAAPAIARGNQIVAFGDPVTDHPIPFNITPGEEVLYPLGTRSVLTDLAQFLPTHALTMSYRPLGTALASQISAHLYTGGLHSWPQASSALGDTGMSFIHVNGFAPLDEKTARIEGTPAEVDAIVANVVEHATLHPEQTLMVVSISAVTVSKVQAAIQAALPANRTLQDFFSRHIDNPFVILTVQQASAITRDRVIFSLGFGRTPHGRILSDLGSLSTPDGERLVAVAMTRANRHLTVISSLTTDELRDERMSPGAHELARFIDDTIGYLAVPGEHHPLLDDLGKRLEKRGATIVRDVPGIPLAARINDTCVAIDIDDNLMELSLREGLRVRPAMLQKCGWEYARVHELQLFLSPELVADRIEGMLRGGQAPI
jgi:hypothetical protein